MGISKWNAGIIRPVPVAPAGPLETGAAPGVWTLDQEAYWQKQGLWPTAGTVANYIEDSFSTYLYTGNGSTQTITNNIDLAGKGGLTWIKNRDTAGYSNLLIDTVRGATKQLSSNTTDAQSNVIYGLTAFNSTGFSLNFDSEYNQSSKTYVSWTFRKQPKFFDVQTFTTAASVPTYSFSHNLASTPGCIIIKSLGADDWYVWHTSLNPAYNLVLNQSSGQANRGATWITTVNSTTIASTVTGGPNPLNANTTYVAYIFAHNAGGFGLTGNDNVISCGTFTTDGTGAAGNITLGYESQLVMFKRTDGVGNWQIVDIMRGSSLTSYNYISPTVSSAESSSTSTQGIYPTATGFYVGNNFPGANQTYVYIAIRRGPMKVPTLGTTVFSPQVQTPTAGANNVIATNSGFPIDWLPTKQPNNVVNWFQTSRLTNNYMNPNTAAAEGAYQYGFDKMAGVGGGSFGWDAQLTASYAFRRAPGFFDVVCYTGTGVAGQTYTHNLSVVPELMIVKGRSIAEEWNVYYGVNTKYLKLNSTDIAQTATTRWNDTSPTSSVFTVGTSGWVNQSGSTYVAYLFATATGVSKVGSYTGTGALQTVACGFTSGARFVLVKRVDSTGDWYVWDSARGITSGNDPYLLINSTAAEVTSTNYVDTDTTGFKVTAAAPAALNAVGGTYIFLAIA